MEIATPAANGVSKPANKGQQTLTEIPSSLRTLARLVVRGFHSIEDALIIDMLVRYPCLREDDVSALLKFDKKNLRSRMAALKNDKLVQVIIASKGLHTWTLFNFSSSYHPYNLSMSIHLGKATYRDR